SWLSNRGETWQQLDSAETDFDSILPDPQRRVTIIDALDQIDKISQNSAAIAGISDQGYSSLCDAAKMLRRLRTIANDSIASLVQACERELRLDIELQAHPRFWTGASGGAGQDPRANIYMLQRVIADYLKNEPGASLPQVLDWIELADSDDELAAVGAEPVPGTVHLTTVHAAKGLEWDAVAVIGLSSGSFPNKPKNASGWLGSAERMPYPLRLDAHSLPQLNLRGCETQKEVAEALKQFKEQNAIRHDSDERRVAYVAFTRAKKELRLSCAAYKKQNLRAEKPGPYLTEITANQGAETEPETIDHITAPVLLQQPDGEIPDVNPALASDSSTTWPKDPLGQRRHAVETAAAAVREQQVATEPVAPLSAELELLVAEAIERKTQANNAPAKKRINASSFAAQINNSEEQKLQELRPIPQPPVSGSDLGNRFHAWVERRYTTAAGQSETLPGLDQPIDSHRSQPDTAPDEKLAFLQQQFLQSRFAQTAPKYVEQEIAIPFAEI
ncbi:MAG: 3'-5' exonuclease, partial [Microbacteriaceae bacterium]|nr:3'-5' exonuclease [Microbacteriaceae bacterium]